MTSNVQQDCAAASAERAISMADAAAEFLDGATTLPMIQLVKRQICRPKDRVATDEELALFIAVCRQTQLNPFARQICAVFRWDRRLAAEKMSIQTTIDGFRLIAQRTGDWEGYAGPAQWCGGADDWCDVWLRTDLPKAARVAVWRRGHREAADGLAHLEMFRDDRSPMWTPGPKSAHMLAKCAEALALRRAFPQELSGLYTEDEMARADVIDGTAVAVAAADEPRTLPEALPADMCAALTRAAGLVGWTEGEGLATLTLNLVDLGATDTSDPVAAIGQLTPEAGEELNRRISTVADARGAAEAGATS
jgi:phage recombination protein Bet